MTSVAHPASAAVVLTLGASSPIGYGVKAIQAAMAGGLRNFQAGSVMADRGEPARTSRMPDIEEAAPRAERLAWLFRLAAADLMQRVAVPLPSAVPVYVGLAHESASADLPVIVRALAEGSRESIAPDLGATVSCPDGRIAFLTAIARAIDAFDEGRAELALVAAGDTRCTYDALDALIRERRLLTEQDDGTVPGEAAVIALLASGRSNLAAGQRFLVAAPTFAADAVATLRESPQVAQGLGQAFRALRERAASAVRAGSVVGFESGELFFTRAFTTGYLRNAELMPEPLEHELIATYAGDTGAAAGGLALVRAEGLMNGTDGDDRSVLLYGHADDGRCATAMAIRRQRGTI